MARRSTKIGELREKHELSCMWGLFSILESCEGGPRRKLISNGRRVNKQIIDYPRKLDQLASFDEECRKIQNEAGLRGVAVDAGAKCVGNFNREEMAIDKHNRKDGIVKRLEHTKMDSDLDRIVKTEKIARKSSENANHSYLCCLGNEASLNHLPSTSSEISLNKLTLATLLDAVCGQNHPEKSKLFEKFNGSSYLGKHDQVNEIDIQKVQMRAQAMVDQMYTDGKYICKEGMFSKSESFSSALEVLNSNKEPNENYPSQSAKETLKSVLDASGSAEPRSVLARQKGNMNKNSRQKSDKIVILRPAPRKSKHSENVLCHCSSLHSYSKSGREVPNGKTSSFSFREMKRKLKHTFGGTSDKLSRDRSTPRVGDECICGGVEIRNSFDSSTNAEQKGKLLKKQYLNSTRGSDSACLNDSALKKLDFSSIGFLKKQDFDVILEAKRHLSARLNNLSSVEAVTSNRSPKTLGRILFSPEHDFLRLSPRRDTQYCSDSTQMRYSPYNTSPLVNKSSSEMPNIREMAGLSPLRSNTEFQKNHGILQMMDAKACTPTPRTQEEALDSDISTTGCMKFNGEPKTLEMNNIRQPASDISEEVSSEVKDGEIESPNDDEIEMRSILDSLSETEAISSTVDDFPSTSFSIYQLDTANCIKYQEERQSPVSVLEPFFIEDADSPPNITLLTAKKRLQPRCLHFEECSFESITRDPSITANSYMEAEEEEDHISQYVQLILQASCLNWDQLSQFMSPPEELLHASLFDEVEFPLIDCYYDPKLLFDHINEVLLEIYKSFCSPTWPAFTKQKLGSVSLVEHVLDEIMRESEFYLLPTTERRTLDQLVSEDVAKCSSWLDVRLDTEQVVIEISEDVLEESVLDIVLEFCT